MSGPVFGVFRVHGVLLDGVLRRSPVFHTPHNPRTRTGAGVREKEGFNGNRAVCHGAEKIIKKIFKIVTM